MTRSYRHIYVKKSCFYIMLYLHSDNFSYQFWSIGGAIFTRRAQQVTEIVLGVQVLFYLCVSACVPVCLGNGTKEETQK